MSEDRTAGAALAIEKYVAGLRAEVALLGPAASADLVSEVRDMLLDVAREDPEKAFAEMLQLGEPSVLAATLLAERGIAPAGGIPAASWWRLGVAAVIDIVVGLAAPTLIVVAFWNLGAALLVVPGPAGIILFLGLACALGLALWLSWNYWAPWRNGGPRSTPGMALARISVVRLGDTRTVARVEDLARAGLAVPTVKASSPGVIGSVVLAVVLLAVTVTAVSGGALDPSGTRLVERLAGPEQTQRTQVLASVDALYQAASTQPPAIAVWPVISEAHLDPSIVEGELSTRFKSATGGAPGYADTVASEVAPGAWEVSLTEAPGSPSQRDVLLTYTLRVEWSLDKWGTSEPTPVPSWVLTAYEPTP